MIYRGDGGLVGGWGVRDRQRAVNLSKQRLRAHILLCNIVHCTVDLACVWVLVRMRM